MTLRSKTLKLIEETGLGKPVSQYDCEVICKRGEFGRCRYFAWINGIAVCIRNSYDTRLKIR